MYIGVLVAIWRLRYYVSGDTLFLIIVYIYTHIHTTT